MRIVVDALITAQLAQGDMLTLPDTAYQYDTLVECGQMYYCPATEADPIQCPDG